MLACLTRRAWTVEDRELLGLLARQAADALVRARRLAAKERMAKLDAALRMAHTGAHCINNPPTVAVANLAMVLDGGLLEAEDRQRLEDAQAALVRTAEAVRRMNRVMHVVEREDAGTLTLDLEAGPRAE